MEVPDPRFSANESEMGEAVVPVIENRENASGIEI